MSSPIEEIKKRVDIVDLVGSYLRLAKAGANFKAVCPFHNEKTPSFYVSPAREIFHCFGCNAGGDIFRFVSMIEGVEFPEALEMLAQRAGVVLRRENPRLTSERKRLLQLVEDATRYYQSELLKNNDVKEYLKSRGLTGETARSFRLGYAPDGWENILGHLKQKEYSSEEIEKAGLAISRIQESGSGNRYYDRFRSRIMFPVSDSGARVVGFSGRIFNKETNEGKYINTPNTILYDKSRVLYLWDRARNDIRKENSCILVEGQMDALLSHQAGVLNVVATSGTALGPGHLALIGRLASKLLLAFDTDEAGQLASRRAFELSLESGFDVNIIEVPEGKDPADTVKENPELWIKAVSEAKPVIAFFLDNLKKKFSGDLYKLRWETKEAVFPYIARLADEIQKAHWVQEASKILELKEEPLWEEVRKLSRVRKNEKITKSEVSFAAQRARSRRHLVEERILGILTLKKENFLEKLESDIRSIFSPESLPLLEVIQGGVSPSQELGARISRLALEAELVYSDTENLDEEFKDLLAELEREAVKARLEFLSDEIRKMELAGEKTRLSEYLKEFQSVSRKLNHLWQESRLKK